MGAFRRVRRGPTIAVELGGSHDGIGAADRDQPFRFGSRPSARWTCPFTAEQYYRLLLLRGRTLDGAFASDGGPLGGAS